MKQRITVEQLQELTEEQQQRLREWWKREFGDVFYITDYKNNKEAQLQVLDRSWQLIVKEYRKEFLPLLSIGQMIELIENNGVSWQNGLFLVDSNLIIFKSYGGELVDALWQAVKEIL